MTTARNNYDVSDASPGVRRLGSEPSGRTPTPRGRLWVAQEREGVCAWGGGAVAGGAALQGGGTVAGGEASITKRGG